MSMSVSVSVSVVLFIRLTLDVIVGVIVYLLNYMCCVFGYMFFTFYVRLRVYLLNCT